MKQTQTIYGKDIKFNGEYLSDGFLEFENTKYNLWYYFNELDKSYYYDDRDNQVSVKIYHITEYLQNKLKESYKSKKFFLEEEKDKFEKNFSGFDKGLYEL